jgi:hypothetical protein
MQSVSATLLAAIQSAFGRPRARVRVDWQRDGYTGAYADVSGAVESVTVDRSITTDLPEQAQLVSGYGAAEASVELAGQVGGVAVSRLLSPYDSSSPLAAAARVASPVDVDFGFVGDAGTEWVDGFVGRVRSVGVGASSGSVSVDALDASEAIRTPVNLPGVVAQTGSGVSKKQAHLSAQWVMDLVLRASGVLTGPALRPLTVLSWTMRGSAAPDVGTLTYAEVPWLDGGGTTDTFEDIGGALALTSGDILAAPAGPLSLNAGESTYIQMWYRWHGDTTDLITGRTAPGVSSPKLQFSVDTGGELWVHLIRAGAVQVVQYATPLALSPGVRSFIGLHVTHSATSVTLRFCLNGTEIGPIVSPLAAVSGIADLASWQVGADGTGDALDSVQVTTEPWSAGM